MGTQETLICGILVKYCLTCRCHFKVSLLLALNIQRYYLLSIDIGILPVPRLQKSLCSVTQEDLVEHRPKVDTDFSFFFI